MNSSDAAIIIIIIIIIAQPCNITPLRYFSDDD